MATPLVIKAFFVNQKLDDLFLRGMKTRLQWNQRTFSWKIESNPSKSFYIQIYGKLSFVMGSLVVFLLVEQLSGLRFLTIMTKVAWSFMLLFVTLPYLFDFLVYFYGTDIVYCVNFLMRREKQIHKIYQSHFGDVKLVQGNY